jgi:hypothetical protein
LGVLHATKVTVGGFYPVLTQWDMYVVDGRH